MPACASAPRPEQGSSKTGRERVARVLVTRPEPGASATAKRLRALGHEAIVLPLSEIRPLDPDLPEPAAIDAVAATSANALRHLNPERAGSLLEKPCFTVGGRTGEAARRAGFSDVRSSDADAAALARLVAAELPQQSRVLYLCGRVRRPEFEAGLYTAGIRCLPVEIYDTTFTQPDAALQSLATAPPDIVLVYSVKTAEVLRDMMSPPEPAPTLANARFFCLSEAVARALGTLVEGRTYWNKEPDEQALFALLSEA